MPLNHTVQQGESVVQLAEKHGLFAMTIWDDAANADLKAKRRDMNVLMPGDVVVIRDKKTKSVDAVTGKRHQFRRKGVPAYFRLQLFRVYEPRAKEAYKLFIDDGPAIEGTTDDKGVLELFVAPGAKAGKLVIGPDALELRLQFGHLDPHDEVTGIQKRLNNIGYRAAEPTGILDEETKRALAELQAAWGLTGNGEPNEATIQKLTELHDQVGTAVRSVASEPS